MHFSTFVPCIEGVRTKSQAFRMAKGIGFIMLRRFKRFLFHTSQNFINQNKFFAPLDTLGTQIGVPNLWKRKQHL